MRFRAFSEQAAGIGIQSVVEEIRCLIRNGSPDAQYAGLDFTRALKQMAAKHQLIASPLPRHVWMPFFGASESLWAREVRRHSLYLSRIDASSARGDIEVRALLACNGVDPEPARVQKAADRHKKM